MGETIQGLQKTVGQGEAPNAQKDFTKRLPSCACGSDPTVERNLSHSVSEDLDLSHSRVSDIQGCQKNQISATAVSPHLDCGTEVTKYNWAIPPIEELPWYR